MHDFNAALDVGVANLVARMRLKAACDSRGYHLSTGGVYGGGNEVVDVCRHCRLPYERIATAEERDARERALNLEFTI